VRADFDEVELDDLTRRANWEKKRASNTCKYRRGKNRDSEDDTGTPTSCESLNLADSSTPSDTRRSALGRIETCAELGVEGELSEMAE
jgi:hypothetical protein